MFHILMAPFLLEITSVLNGCAPGVDSLGAAWAESIGMPVIPYPADWKKYGQYRAGPIRNTQMALNADALICIHHGTSGSLDMARKARQAKLLIHEVYVHPRRVLKP